MTTSLFSAAASSSAPAVGSPATVLIAAYNEAKHIAQSLESLLAQTHAPLEIVVIDDGSTDRTAEVVGRYPTVRLIRQGHLGKATAVNRGAAEAAGEVLLFLDGDMYFDREYVARLVEPIAAGRAIGTCHLDEFVANRANPWAACWQRKAGLPPDRRVLLTAAQREEGSVVYRAVRKDRFLAVGGFDDTGFFDDQTLCPKLKERAVFVEGAVCHHYNPETLAEVFRSGVWGGKSIAHQGNWRPLLGYLPPVILGRAVGNAFRERMSAVFLYDLARECGIFYGMFRMLTRWDPAYGK